MRDNTVITECASRCNSSARINRRYLPTGIPGGIRAALFFRSAERPATFLVQPRDTKRTASSRNPGDGEFLRSPPVARATALDPLFRSSAPIRCHISCRPWCTTRQFSEARENRPTINDYPAATCLSRCGLVCSSVCPRCAPPPSWCAARLLTLSAKSCDDDKSGVA